MMFIDVFIDSPADGSRRKGGSPHTPVMRERMTYPDALLQKRTAAALSLYMGCWESFHIKKIMRARAPDIFGIAEGKMN